MMSRICLKCHVIVLLLTLGVAGCSLLNTFSECEVDGDCGENSFCQDSGLCVELNLNIEPCIGAGVLARNPETCRAQLESLALNYPDSRGGCFFIQTEGYPPAYNSFTWRNGALLLNPVEINFVEGAQFNTHLYFMTRTGPDLSCEDLQDSLSQRCANVTDCVVKLTSPPQTFDSRRLTVSYQDPEGVCGSSQGRVNLRLEGIDGADNDCDGLVDEASQYCVIGEGLCRSEGILTTSVTGDPTCNAEVYLSQTDELCGTELDEDCDGLVDEGFEQLGQSCQVSDGEVSRFGTYACTISRTELECKTSELDRCDGLDQDGDGQVDEDHQNSELSCPDGSCSDRGYLLCINGALTNSCSAGGDAQGLDVCDGVDNDCDGSVDEGAAEMSVSCGEGSCQAEGILSCVMGQERLDCTPFTPQEELCDQRDNDCDNLVDEGDVCDGICTPEPELCDGRDNDCDGQTDEGLLNACGECGPLPTETCDPVDNDCDGQVDEGLMDCPLSTLRACRSVLTWYDIGEGASREFSLNEPGFRPLVPSWSYSLDSNDAPFIPKEGEALSLQMICDETQPWGAWISEHCGLSLVWSDRAARDEYRSAEFNPQTCTEGGSPNANLTNRCVSSHIDGVLTIQDEYDRFGLHFSCPLQLDPQDVTLARHVSGLFTYKLLHLQQNEDGGRCPLPVEPCTECEERSSGASFFAENVQDCDALYFGVELSSP